MFLSSVFKLLSTQTRRKRREIIAVHVGKFGKHLSRETLVKRCLNSSKTVILNEMVITNPVEQLRGLWGPTEPRLQNKPATRTCGEETQGGGKPRGGRGGDPNVQCRQNALVRRGQKRERMSSGNYFNCEISPSLLNHSSPRLPHQ